MFFSFFPRRGVAVAGPASATTRRDGYASPPRCVPVASDEAVSLGVALTVSLARTTGGSATPTHQLARTTGVAVRPASACSISSSSRSNRGCRLAWPAFWPGEEVWFCAVGCSAVAKSPEGCVVNWDWRGRAACFWPSGACLARRSCGSERGTENARVRTCLEPLM